MTLLDVPNPVSAFVMDHTAGFILIVVVIVAVVVGLVWLLHRKRG